MNTFIEAATSFFKKKETEEAWKRALLATQQSQLKHFLGFEDEELQREEALKNAHKIAGCIGNPLLRMNE